MANYISGARGFGNGAIGLVVTTQGSEAIMADLNSRLSLLEGVFSRFVSEAWQRSNRIAPIKTGRLRFESGWTVRANFGGLHGWTGGVHYDVPYAERRHYENFSNPHTLYYLDRGFEETAMVWQ